MNNKVESSSTLNNKTDSDKKPAQNSLQTNTNAQNNVSIQELKVNEDITDDIFDAPTDQSMQIWGDILLEIKGDNEHLLYAMCDGVSGTEIAEEEFILHTNTRESYDELNEVSVREKLQNYLSHYLDKKLVVKYEELVDESQEDFEYLKSKFGDKLKIIP